MLTVAVLPVKSFSRAKQRLDAAVRMPAREGLAAAMVEDVLEALGRVDGIDRVVVVTAEPQAVALALAAGAEVVHDGVEAGQSAAAALGIAAAADADRVLLIPGDCPAVDPQEVETLLASGAEREVAVVPDRHGTGTNALLLTPPDVIAPAFGPGSFERHRAAAGAALRVAQLPSLALDLDTPVDLAALAGRLGGAQRTRACLLELAAA